MHIIAADIGNHAIKLGLFSPESAAQSWPAPEAMLALAEEDASRLAAWLPEEELHWIFASVHKEKEAWLDRFVEKHRPTDIKQGLQPDDIPLDIDLENSAQVGIDRLCAALAGKRWRASQHLSEKGEASATLPLILIDAGTAITVDAVSAEGAFLGGAILPGIDLAARSLAEGADALPKIAIRSTAPHPIGKSTRSAIEAGVYWGGVGGVEAIVRRMGEAFGGPFDLLITGGNGEIFASELEWPNQFLPTLTLSGILLAHHK